MSPAQPLKRKCLSPLELVPSTGRILLMDDSEIILEVIREKLFQHGFDVATAGSAREALKRATVDAEPFDLFILDICMPDMSGFEVVEVLRAHPSSRDTPILLLTSLNTSEDKLRGLRAGGDDFLNKTVSDVELVARVRSLVSLGKLRRLSTGGFAQHLPIRPDESSPKEEDGQERILVVHRDTQKRQHLTALLGTNSRVVREAEDVSRASELVREHPCEVVFVGFSRTDASQRDLVVSLRQEETPPAVLFVDDQPSFENRLAAFSAGADDYIPESISGEELEARIANALGRLRRYRELKSALGRALVAAMTDPLTGIFNRGHFQKALHDEFERARRYELNLALIVMDVDHFKAVNDRHGHATGDEVLKMVADVLRRSVRATDSAARIGGEEFAAVLPHTRLPDGLCVAERVRKSISEASVLSPSGERIQVTASFGVAAFPQGGRCPEELLARADGAMYAAKQSGRNRVVGMGDSVTQLLPAVTEADLGPDPELAATLGWMLADGLETPLTTIHTAVTMLVDGCTPEEPPSPFLRKLKHASGNLIDLLSQLLAKSKVTG